MHGLPSRCVARQGGLWVPQCIQISLKTLLVETLHTKKLAQKRALHTCSRNRVISASITIDTHERFLEKWLMHDVEAHQLPKGSASDTQYIVVQLCHFMERQTALKTVKKTILHARQVPR